MFNSLAMKEMQIKMALRSYPPQSEWLSPRTQIATNSPEGSVYCLWQCELVQPLLKSKWRSLKKFKKKTPYDAFILLWAYIQRYVSQNTIDMLAHPSKYSQ
jgi:hypothetical protein